MARLNQERQKRLEPLRMENAKALIESCGFVVSVIGDKTLIFVYNGSYVTVHPYSGWCSGKTIKDCRGIDNLIQQIESE